VRNAWYEIDHKRKRNEKVRKYLGEKDSYPQAVRGGNGTRSQDNLILYLSSQKRGLLGPLAEEGWSGIPLIKARSAKTRLSEGIRIPV